MTREHADLRGRAAAKRVLEAAAGGHGLGLCDLAERQADRIAEVAGELETAAEAAEAQP